MAGDIHVGDTPLHKMQITDQSGAIVDVSGASTKQMLFKKPNGDLLTKTATNTTDGTDGWIEYQAVITDHDIPGENWRKEARVVIGSTDWGGTIITFPVRARLS